MDDDYYDSLDYYDPLGYYDPGEDDLEAVPDRPLFAVGDPVTYKGYQGERTVHGVVEEQSLLLGEPCLQVRWEPSGLVGIAYTSEVVLREGVA